MNFEDIYEFDVTRQKLRKDLQFLNEPLRYPRIEVSKDSPIRETLAWHAVNRSIHLLDVT
jgi:hypothetical protein